MRELIVPLKFDADLLSNLRQIRRRAERSIGGTEWYIVANRVHEEALLRIASGTPPAIDGMVLLPTDSYKEGFIYLRQRTREASGKPPLPASEAGRGASVGVEGDLRSTEPGGPNPEVSGRSRDPRERERYCLRCNKDFRNIRGLCPACGAPLMTLEQKASADRLIDRLIRKHAPKSSRLDVVGEGG